MPQITIRPFQGTDLEAVLAIWNRALVWDPISESRLVSGILGDADYWPGEDSGFLVAVRQDQPIGFLRAIIRRQPNDRAGLEPEHGWIPVVAVDPAHQRSAAGTALLEAGLSWFRRHGRKHIWVCGNSGSAPGYFFPGVDQDVYAGGLGLFRKAGFVIDHEAVSMSREAVNFDVETFRKQAWETGKDVEIRTLSPGRVHDFFAFLAEAFPGDWNICARAKVRSGALHEVLIAVVGGRVVGYCQWEGEHFGPFGVRPEVRNQKIGAKLFVEAVQRIRQADGRTAWFNWADDDAARFYRRFGMVATRRFALLRKDL